MTSNKIAEAEKGCDKALNAWRAAILALGTEVSVNGFGILHDPAALTQRLQDAKRHIDESLLALRAVSWPTGHDYDEEG